MIRLERNNLTVLPESVYDLLNVRELNIGGNPLEPLDDIHLWTYGDPIHRFKDTANKLEEITPVPILRSEPGAKQTDGIRFTHILCNNHFSIAGCRYGDHCMFSHIPPPLPTIPFQIDKEKLAESDAKQIQEGTYPGNRSKYYGVKHSKYAKVARKRALTTIGGMCTTMGMAATGTMKVETRNAYNCTQSSILVGTRCIK
jgi:hypothetical protein